MVLVLLSTLGQAPHSYTQRLLTCSSKPKALPCKSSVNPSWTLAVLPDSGPHSLISQVSEQKLATSFLDPISVGSMALGGLCLVLLLGVTAWTIVTMVWIVCTAVVLRINPLPTRRIRFTTSVKQYSKPGRFSYSLSKKST